MELIDQHTKAIMEECKTRARDAGLKFDNETLEYIVTNRDLLELSPKYMIPTLYDYWVHDVEVLREKGKYELYPSNPYETVINTRPAISFYNDNNPDWLNVMIFYHVIAHIDFFQNNIYFRHTWDYDFTGRALSDKRLIAKLRAERGRWVDYVIEFTRGIDNLVGYYHLLYLQDQPSKQKAASRLDFYFDYFLQSEIKVKSTEYLKEIDRYNETIKQYQSLGEETFFADVKKKYPEFDSIYKKMTGIKSQEKLDLIQYIIDNSPFLRKEENQWMKSVMEVVRNTSLFFQPQIRTKIMNEGWASYWHEKLFLQDERISGHEVDFARVNSGVVALPRIGINPYALGMRLFETIERNNNRGRYSLNFQRIKDAEQRKKYDQKQQSGQEYIAEIRHYLNDYIFLNSFIDQDFVDEYKLFVAGKRLNQARMVWEYYVKSRKAEDYKQMLLNSLYHPPHITIDPEKTKEDTLYLNHHFESKPLVKDFIPNTMVGLEFFWGGQVKLETTEAIGSHDPKIPPQATSDKDKIKEQEIKFIRVLYTMQNRKISRREL